MRYCTFSSIVPASWCQSPRFLFPQGQAGGVVDSPRGDWPCRAPGHEPPGDIQMEENNFTCLFRPGISLSQSVHHFPHQRLLLWTGPAVPFPIGVQLTYSWVIIQDSTPKFICVLISIARKRGLCNIILVLSWLRTQIHHITQLKSVEELSSMQCRLTYKSSIWLCRVAGKGLQKCFVLARYNFLWLKLFAYFDRRVHVQVSFVSFFGLFWKISPLISGLHQYTS